MKVINRKFIEVRYQCEVCKIDYFNKDTALACERVCKEKLKNGV
jgi:hypothetical protein